MPQKLKQPPWGTTPPMFLSAQALRAEGMTRRQMAKSVSDGRLIRVRNGRLLPTGAHADVIQAARLGGRVDCVSLLRHLGVFVLEKAPLHIQVDVGASRLPSCPTDVVRHWRTSPAPREQLITDLEEALTQATRCQEPRAAIATLDSAWHLGLIDEEGITDIFARLPPRFRALRPLLEPRCESGAETLLRLMLRSLGCHIDVQVKLRGVGRVDFIVDGWLVIECDSEAHHSGWDKQKRDRRRDVAAARLGYSTIRVLAEDIMYHREKTLTALKEVVRHGARRVGVQNSSRTRRVAAR